MWLAWMRLRSFSLLYTIMGLPNGQIVQAVQSEEPKGKSKNTVKYKTRHYVFTGSVIISISSLLCCLKIIYRSSVQKYSGLNTRLNLRVTGC